VPKQGDAGSCGSSRGFDFDPALQPHESAFGRRDGGVGLAAHEIEHVHDRAADMLLPGEYDQTVAKRDGLIGDGVGEPGISPDTISTVSSRSE
jgi:hypothetical protein